MNEYPHLITVQDKVYISDGSGGKEPQWTDFIKDIPALVLPSTWKERVEAQQNQSIVDYKIFIEYDNRIKPDMIIVYEDEPFEIKAIIDQGGQKEVMAIMTVSKDGD